MKYKNREKWLMDFAKECVTLFAESKHMIEFPKGIKLNPDSIKFTCGFPPNMREKQSMMGKNRRYSARGVCYPKAQDVDKKNHIFIIPDHCHQNDVVQLGSTTIHEMIHAVDDCDSGHGKAFKDMAVAIGFMTGKKPNGGSYSMRSTEASPKLIRWIKKTAKKLGAFPQKKWVHRGIKQTTRMIKLVCPDGAYSCESIVRLSRKALLSGAPICGCTSEERIQEVGLEQCRMVEDWIPGQ